MILTIYKPLGKTPLEVIEYYKKKHNIHKISYAGRLDPMAQGVLLLLTDSDCFKQNTFHNLSKIYRFKLLIGISTDTYDCMGFINNRYNKSNNNLDIQSIVKQIQNKFIGEQIQDYPPYSSVRVDGKPLWVHAKNNNLDNIKIPSKLINIFSLKFMGNQKIEKNKLIRENLDIIKNINGDFRQDKIKDSWLKNSENINDYLEILEFEAFVSCGTFIRSLCYNIGKLLNLDTCAYRINRIKVGEYTL